MRVLGGWMTLAGVWGSVGALAVMACVQPSVAATGSQPGVVVRIEAEAERQLTGAEIKGLLSESVRFREKPLGALHGANAEEYFFSNGRYLACADRTTISGRYYIHGDRLCVRGRSGASCRTIMVSRRGYRQAHLQPDGRAAWPPVAVQLQRASANAACGIGDAR